MSATPKSPVWLEPIDHTADVGICVRASTVEELFARSAWGMFSVIAEMDAVYPRESMRITLEADERGSLLVRWLSELNYRHVTMHRLFSKFDIAFVTDDGRRLEAEVGGEPIDRERHTIHTEIKAVTYHELWLAHDETGWKARIIFDV